MTKIYNIDIVAKNMVNGNYAGSCREFPSCYCTGDTPEDVVNQIRYLVTQELITEEKPVNDIDFEINIM